MKHTSKLKLNNNVKVFNVFKYLVLIFAFLLVGMINGEKVDAGSCTVTGHSSLKATNCETSNVKTVSSMYVTQNEIRIDVNHDKKTTATYVKVVESNVSGYKNIQLRSNDTTKRMSDDIKIGTDGIIYHEYKKYVLLGSDYWEGSKTNTGFDLKRYLSGSCLNDIHLFLTSDSSASVWFAKIVVPAGFFCRPSIELKSDTTSRGYAKSHHVQFSVNEATTRVAYMWFQGDTDDGMQIIDTSSNKNPIISENNKSGEWELFVEATSAWSRSETYEGDLTFLFDNTDPVISTIRADDTIDWRKSHTATIEVRDDDSGVGAVYYKWSISNAASSYPSSSSKDGVVTLDANGIGTVTKNTGDGEYYLCITVVDRVYDSIKNSSSACTSYADYGNNNVGNERMKFDNTAPVVTFPTQSSYYVEDVSVTPIYTELHTKYNRNTRAGIFYVWSSTTSITINRDESSSYEGMATYGSAITRNGTVNTEESLYLCVRAYDEAGNASSTQCSEQFHFDKKAPRITGVNIDREGSSYTGSATVTDANLSGVTYTWFLNDIDISGELSISPLNSGTSMSSTPYSMADKEGTLKICYDATDSLNHSPDGVCYGISVDHKPPQIGEIKITGGGCINCFTSSTNNKVISEKIEVINNSIVYSEVVVEEDIEVVLYSVVIEDVELDVLEEGIKTDTIEEIPEEIDISEVNHLHVKVKRKEDKVFSLLEYKILYIDDRKDSLLELL